MENFIYAQVCSRDAGKKGVFKYHFGSDAPLPVVAVLYSAACQVCGTGTTALVSVCLCCEEVLYANVVWAWSTLLSMLLCTPKGVLRALSLSFIPICSKPFVLHFSLSTHDQLQWMWFSSLTRVYST